MQVSLISTNDVSRDKRLDYWNNVTSSFFPGMVIDAANDIEASWRSIHVDDIHICIAKSQKSIAHRHQSQSTIKNTNRSKFHLQLKGIINTHQEGRNMIAASGEMSFCNSDKPYKLDISSNNECLVIDFPNDNLIFDKVLAQENYWGTRLHRNMLFDFVNSIFRQNWADVILEKSEELALKDALFSLMRNCIPYNKGNVVDNNKYSDTHKRIIDFIDSHIDDSGMRTGSIAKRLALTEALVQKSFAKFGTTPTQYIQSRRLNIARDKLQNPNFDGTMTDLAYELGFSDSAHFSRLFKNKFKISPLRYSYEQRSK